jgi:hypothetical protein
LTDFFTEDVGRVRRAGCRAPEAVGAAAVGASAASNMPKANAAAIRRAQSGD